MIKNKSPWVFCILPESLIPQGRKEGKQKKVCFHITKPKPLQFWFKKSRGSRLLFNVTWGQCRWVDKYTNRFFFLTLQRTPIPFCGTHVCVCCVPGAAPKLPRTSDCQQQGARRVQMPESHFPLVQLRVWLQPPAPVGLCPGPSSLPGCLHRLSHHSSDVFCPFETSLAKASTS